MNLEQLRKQAKELVKAARRRRAALERLGGEPILARAQLALAREHGYASWPALVAAAEANADAFVRAATSGRRARAEAMLAARPEIARDPWARLTLGEGWDGDASEPGGPNGWAPLLYVCFSRLRLRRPRPRAAGPRRRPQRHVQERVRRHAGAVRRGGRDPQPRADARPARGGRERRRRRVALPRDRGARPGVPAAGARVRRQPGADRARARARLRPPGARQGAARRRRRRRRAAAVRRPPRPRAGDPAAARRARRAARGARRRGLAQAEAPAHRLPARGAARARRLRADAGRARRRDARRRRRPRGGRDRPRRAAGRRSRPTSTTTSRRC